MAEEFSKEITDKYSIKNNAFRLDKIQNAELDKKGEPKDEINVFVGDDKQPDKFYPQVKIERWTNEANFSVRLQDNEIGEETVSTDKDKIVWDKGNIKAEFYEAENAYKFVWYLKSKPKTNKVQFTIQSKDVDFYYQPPLTEEKLEEGQTADETHIYDKDGNVVAERPENVVGSYAVYSKSSGGMNDINGKDYKVGKVGHIYRPHLFDAEGKEAWGNLHIENGIYSVEIPQDFLDKAVYPIKSNDNFGYETKGGSQSYLWLASPIISDYGSKFALTETGELTAVTGWFITYQTTCKFVMAVYDSSLDLVEQTAEEAGGVGSWVDFEKSINLNSNPTKSSGDYWLVARSNGGTGKNTRLYYDTGDANQGGVDVTESYSSTFPSSMVWDSTDTRKHSIYATYTPSATETNITVNASIQASTYSQPTPTITTETNISVSASIQEFTANLISATVSTVRSVAFSAGILTATFTGLSPTVSIYACWYNTDWNYRQKITIDNTKVPSSQIDIPILVKITDGSNDIFGKAQSDGDDILFTNSSGTQLGHDIVVYEDSEGSEELWIWVKIDSLNGSSNTDIYMYYGNSGASNQENKSGTWSNGYKFVSHLVDQSDHYEEVTGNCADSDAEIIVDRNNTGKIYGDRAPEFAGTNANKDYIQFPDDADLDITSDLQLEALVYPQSFDNSYENGILTKANGADYGVYNLHYKTTSNGFRMETAGDNVLEDTASTTTNQWYWLVGYFDDSANELGIVVNNTKSTKSDVTGSVSTNNLKLQVGMQYWWSTNYSHWDGYIQLIRVLNEKKSDDWNTVQYNTIMDADNFFSLSAEEASVFISPSVETATFSSIQPSISYNDNEQVACSLQSAQFSIPEPTISAQTNVSTSVDIQSAQFSALNPTVSTTSDVSIAGAIQSGTFSQPEASISTIRSVSVSPTIQESTFTVIQPSISYNDNESVSLAVQSSQFSQPEATVSGIINISTVASLQESTFNLIAPDVSGEIGSTNVQADAEIQSATFTSIDPVITVSTNTSIVPDIQTAAFSILQPSISYNDNEEIALSVQSATFSLPTPTIATGTIQIPVIQQAQFNLLEPTINTTKSATVSPAPQTALFSNPTPSLSYNDNEQVSCSLQSLTYSQPQATVSAVRNVSSSAGIQEASFSVIQPSLSVQDTEIVILAVNSASFTVISPEVNTQVSETISPACQSSEFTIISPTITITSQVQVSAENQSSIFSINYPEIIAVRNIYTDADIQEFTFSLPSVIISAYGTNPYSNKSTPYSKATSPYSNKSTPYNRYRNS